MLNAVWLVGSLGAWKKLNFRNAATASCIALLLTGCSKSSAPEPVSVPASEAQGAKPEPVASNGSNAREKECARTEVVRLYCYVGGWNGDSPRIAGMFASTSLRKQNFEGLAHVLEQGELRHIDTVYDRTTGACGEVLQASGAYQGSTYSGTFYCNKTHLLSVPSDLPEKTTTTENILVGRWLRSEEGKPNVEPELREFNVNGKLMESTNGFTNESIYKFFGPAFAVLAKGDSRWWIFRIIDKEGDTIRYENANPGDLKSTVYVLRPDPATTPRQDVPVASPAVTSLMNNPTAPVETFGARPSATPMQSIQPSFDCSKAASRTEKLICSDVELAQLDAALATIYREAKDSARDIAAFNADSRAAFKEREVKCTDKPCLLDWYARRKLQLQAR